MARSQHIRIDESAFLSVEKLLTQDELKKLHASIHFTKAYMQEESNEKMEEILGEFKIKTPSKL